MNSSINKSAPLFPEFSPVGLREWREKATQELKGKDLDTIVWQTPDGFGLQPWYNQDNSLESIRVPFDRKSNHWNICVRIDAGDTAAAALSASEALSGGATAIEFHFTEPSGSDALHLPSILEGIDLAATPLFFSGSIPDPEQLFESLASRSGFSSNRGAILLDAFAVPDARLFCPERADQLLFRTLAVDTTPHHEAGATVTQEVAIALAGVSEYLNHLTDLGIDAGKAASSIVIVLACGTSHFPELAKHRALRALWPVLLDAYCVPEAARPQPHLFTRASARTLSILDPYTNILRLTTEALSAVIGGCDTLQLSSFDSAGPASGDFAARITRNIQLLLQHESALDHIIDPAAGSWYIETITATICRDAWKLFQEIEAAGGLKAALSSGMIAGKIAPAAAARKKAICRRSRTLVGVNRYTVLPTPEIAEQFAANPELSGLLSGDTADFERIRINALQAGTPTKAVLWQHGDPARISRVSAFAGDFLRCGGFEIAETLTLDPEPASCETLLGKEPAIVVLCWSEPGTAESLAAISGKIRELRPGTVIIMAAKPPEHAETLLAAGLDAFIHLGSDACATLSELQHKTGIS